MDLYKRGVYSFLGVSPSPVIDYDTDFNDYPSGNVKSGYLDGPYNLLKQTKFDEVIDCSEFTTGDYKLAHPENMKQINESMARFEKVQPFRETPIFDNFRKEIKEVLQSLFGPQLNQKPISYELALSLQDLSKGGGYDCTLKEHALRKEPNFLRDMVTCDYMWIFDVILWVVAGKDEVRLNTKPVRTYQSSPFWYHLYMTRFVKPQNEAFLEKRHSSSVVLGLELPREWPMIVHRLEKYGPDTFLEWDGQTFDASLMNKLMLLIGEMRSEGLRLQGAEKQRFEHMWLFNVYRLNLMPNGHILATFQGKASGDSSTSSDNSMAHIANLLIIWCNQGLHPWQFPLFLDRIGLCIFGDDAVASYHSELSIYSSFFNNLADMWKANFGVNCVVKFSKQLDGISFLGKRSATSDGLERFMPVVADRDRQMSSLSLKNRYKNGPIGKLQRLVAHRQLLSMDEFTGGSPELVYVDYLINVHLNSNTWIKESSDPDVQALVFSSYCDPRVIAGAPPESLRSRGGDKRKTRINAN